ncbi:MAG: hypothetical protein BWX54_02343 [Verrucomicrobia bacterium ADurb.Bin018]|nr:MAG: hypothetical protein BWX54_02343 [Verrucomicrobia bacterium ADurb.Bin018]
MEYFLVKNRAHGQADHCGGEPVQAGHAHIHPQRVARAHGGGGLAGRADHARGANQAGLRRAGGLAFGEQHKAQRVARLLFFRRMNVCLDDLIGGADGRHLPLPQHKRALAKTADGGHVVTDEEHGASTAGHLFHCAQTFALEGDIAHREYFINQQNGRAQVGRHGERQAHLHSGAIPLDGRIHERFQPGKLHNAVIFLHDFVAAQAQQGAIEKHIFAASQFGMKAGADLQQ